MEFADHEDEIAIDLNIKVPADLFFFKDYVVYVIRVHLEKHCSVGEMKRVLAEEFDSSEQDLSFFFNNKRVGDDSTVTSLGVQKNNYFVICEKLNSIENVEEDNVFFKMICRFSVNMAGVHADTYIGDITRSP